MTPARSSRQKTGRSGRRLAIPSATPLLSPIPPDPAAQEEDEFDDNMESLPLAAIEAELKPKVLQTFDNIADAYKRLRRLQDQDIEFKLKNTTLSPAQEHLLHGKSARRTTTHMRLPEPRRDRWAVAGMCTLPPETQE